MSIEPTHGEDPKTEESDSPSTEMIVQVQLDGLDPTKCLGIGAKLKGNIRRELIYFLK